MILYHAIGLLQRTRIPLNIVALGAVEGVDPPSGEVIADFEDTVNFTTIMCSVTDGGVPPTQLETRWSIQDFRGEPRLQTITNTFDTNLFFVSGDPMSGGGSFLNRLTILRLTSELDGVTVFCGIGAFPQQANFPLRIYRKFSYRYDKLCQMSCFFFVVVIIFFFEYEH